MKSIRNVVGSEVRFSLSPISPCPCGSKKPASSCCLSETGLHKTPASTVFQGAKTGKSMGKSMGKCYASGLGDCDGKRSREHYISESLLHHLNRGNNLTVRGLPWVKNEKQMVSPASLSSRILCERHNSVLSPLDAIAVRLFQAFDEQGVHGSGQQLLHLFNGYDVERWLLKILCGMVCSKNLPVPSTVDLSIPDYWIDIMFCDTPFPENQGLYVCKSNGHRLSGPRGLQIDAITQHGRLSGIGIWVCGYELVLSMTGFPSRLFDGREFAYRPLEFYATGRDFEKSVMFSWDGIADLGTVTVQILEDC